MRENLAMEKRKDTPYKSARLPKEYIEMVENLFNQNFKKHFTPVPKSKKSKNDFEQESFVAFGEIFPDEFLVAVSLKNPDNPLRNTTCYASVDYPSPHFKKEDGKPAASSSETVQYAMNHCVDAIAGFFSTFFEEGRPVDYDLEYRQSWTPIQVEKVTVHIKINRDNLELESQADALLEMDTVTDKKKKLN